MHVAVAGWLTALGPSGATRRLIAQLRATSSQLRSGERVTLLGTPGLDPRIDGIDYVPVDIPSAPTWKRATAERRVLPRVLAEIDADLLDLATLPAPSGLPVPVCLTIHDLRDLGPFRRRPKLLSRFVLRRSVNRCAHVIVPSAFTCAELAANLASHDTPITVGPGAVDDAFFTAHHPRDDPAYFLHVGHLEPRKNLAMLLDAYSIYAQASSDPTPELWFAGVDRGSGAALERAAHANGCSTSIRFLGKVADAELHTLYAGATAVVVPSFYEGFGLPALEGLAAGAPVLVSDRGALPECVGSAGTIVPAEDTRAWARALAARGSSTGREYARAFTWQSCAARILDVWRTAVRTRR